LAALRYRLATARANLPDGDAATQAALETLADEIPHI
jgi:hypothetical protein